VRSWGFEGLTPGAYPMPCAFATTTPATRAKPAPISVIRLMMSPVASTAKNDAQYVICGLDWHHAAPDFRIADACWQAVLRDVASSGTLTKNWRGTYCPLVGKHYPLVGSAVPWPSFGRPLATALDKRDPSAASSGT